MVHSGRAIMQYHWHAFGLFTYWSDTEQVIGSFKSGFTRRTSVCRPLNWESYQKSSGNAFQVSLRTRMLTPVTKDKVLEPEESHKIGICPSLHWHPVVYRTVQVDRGVTWDTWLYSNLQEFVIFWCATRLRFQMWIPLSGPFQTEPESRGHRNWVRFYKCYRMLRLVCSNSSWWIPTY